MNESNQEHPLFRACMQTIVAIEQEWSRKAMLEQAERLRVEAYRFQDVANSKKNAVGVNPDLCALGKRYGGFKWFEKGDK